MDKKLPSPIFLTTASEAKSSSHGKSNKILLMPGLVGSGIPQISTSPEKPKEEFAAPKPYVQKQRHAPQKTEVPHFSSPEGMLMPSSMQPPPMYGPRGATIPPKYLPEYKKSPHKDENESWCDVCDTSFPSLEELDKHKNEHKMCGVDGCSFFGGPTALASHLEGTHNSGLYSKIKKMSTPEEILKWREDRRKKYPTNANIELRRKFQEAKIKRGEKIEKTKSRFGRPEDRRRMNNQNQGPDQRIVLRKPKGNSMKTKKTERPPPNLAPKDIKKEALETETHDQDNFFKGTLPLFRGTSLLEDYIRPKVKRAKLNPLANLLGMYGSDDDGTDSDDETDEEIGGEKTKKQENLTQEQTELNQDRFNSSIASSSKKADDESNTEQQHPREIASSDDGLPQEIPVKKLKESIEEESLEKVSVTQPKSNKCTTPTKIASSDDEMPEEIPAKRIKEDIKEETKETEFVQPNSTTAHSSKKRTRRKRNNNPNQTEAQPKIKEPKKGLLNYSKLKTSRQNTMLEKLLEPDIRHERNVLLQCVRYVVENNFFGIGSKVPS